MPSRKVTEPLGVPPPCVKFLTVAVKVAGRPNVAGRGVAVALILVGNRKDGTRRSVSPA